MHRFAAKLALHVAVLALRRLYSCAVRPAINCFLYAEQLNACMLGGVILVVAATLLLRLS
jgi:hypothetical protein